MSLDSISMNDSIVVPGNKLRREMNNLFITHYSTFCKVFVPKATDSCKRGKLSDEHKEIMKTVPCTQSDGLPGELPLFVGMPVFLTKKCFDRTWFNQWNYYYSSDSTSIE